MGPTGNALGIMTAGNAVISEPFSKSGLISSDAGDGVDIARRTVAKYREALGIPSLRKRIARHYAENYRLAVDPGRDRAL